MDESNIEWSSGDESGDDMEAGNVDESSIKWDSGDEWGDDMEGGKIDKSSIERSSGDDSGNDTEEENVDESSIGSSSGDKSGDEKKGGDINEPSIEQSSRDKCGNNTEEEDVREKNPRKEKQLASRTVYEFWTTSGDSSLEKKVNSEVKFDEGQAAINGRTGDAPGTEYVSLAVSRRRLTSGNHFQVLLLEKKPGLEGTYVRVGCGTLKTGKNIYKESRPCRITIV